MVRGFGQLRNGPIGTVCVRETCEPAENPLAKSATQSSATVDRNRSHGSSPAPGDRASRWQHLPLSPYRHRTGQRFDQVDCLVGRPPTRGRHSRPSYGPASIGHLILMTRYPVWFPVRKEHCPKKEKKGRSPSSLSRCYLSQAAWLIPSTGVPSFFHVHDGVGRTRVSVRLVGCDTDITRRSFDDERSGGAIRRPTHYGHHVVQRQVQHRSRVSTQYACGIGASHHGNPAFSREIQPVGSGRTGLVHHDDALVVISGRSSGTATQTFTPSRTTLPRSPDIPAAVSNAPPMPM